jgi:hypothetical protein
MKHMARVPQKKLAPLRTTASYRRTHLASPFVLAPWRQSECNRVEAEMVVGPQM